MSLIIFPKTTYATYDPLSVPNNKYGIHLIQPIPEESSPAASLVNSFGGDWGYITVLVESKNRDHNKWQEFFNDLRRRHLIPLVRLATEPEGNFWKRPYEGEEQAWADFLGALNWPVKNRYIIIYNEPNQGKEWGNKVDAKSYAKVLDKTIAALKNKNPDFFVLNAGFDASAPARLPQFEDQLTFMQAMNEEVPGIFNKLDGWVSHSYPNPGFISTPDKTGRGSVQTWYWELLELRNFGVSKNLPVFITETGWKHAEGLVYDPNLPSVETVSDYYQQVFQNAWTSDRIVAITPFLLNYQDFPFDHFSFKKPTGEKQSERILGVQSLTDPNYYSIYQTIQNLSKQTGRPIQEIKAELVRGEIYSSIVSEENYNIQLTFKNTGQSIWNDGEVVKLVPVSGGQNLGIETVEIPAKEKIEPYNQYTFDIKMKAPQSGNFTVSFNLFTGNKQFESSPVKFTTQVKSPVILKVISALGWKKNFAGDYILKVKGINGENKQDISLNEAGISEEIEARHLLPDYTFEFSLERPFYLKKILKQKVYTGVNIINFGTMQPDIFSALLDPVEFWKLLPYSN